MKRLFFALAFTTLVNASETPESNNAETTLLQRCIEARAANTEFASSAECLEAFKAVVAQVSENTPAVEIPANDLTANEVDTVEAK